MLRRLRDDQAILSDSFASAHGLEVGDHFRLLSQTRHRPAFEVVGEFDSKLGVFGSVLVTQAAMAREFDQTQDTIDFVETEPGARMQTDTGAAHPALVEGVPVAEVLDQQELKESCAKGSSTRCSTSSSCCWAWQSLISLFGTADALALSIHERRRELGMLRAIGMTRRQVRTMIRYEAVITALIGAILGMILGLAFATLIALPR